MVSIIVACYNQGEYLRDALESILAQTYTEWECVIINDGSTDDTEAIAQDYCRRDGRFVYISQTNQGLVAARNNAIAKSHGRYVLPLDSDDIIEATFLEKAVAVLDHDIEVRIVGCRVKCFGEVDAEMVLGEFTNGDLLIRNYLANSSVFRREDFDSVGGYKADMAGGFEDWELWVSILERGGKAYRIDELLYLYRKHEGSRNCIPEKEQKRLIVTIAKNHVELLYKEYVKLYQAYHDLRLMEKSRSYRMAKAYQSFMIGLKRKLHL